MTSSKLIPTLCMWASPEDPSWETLRCLSSLTCRITGKVATRKPADLAPSQGWWAPPTWRHTAAGVGTLTGGGHGAGTTPSWWKVAQAILRVGSTL